MAQRRNWKAVFDEWQASNLPISIYCKTNHISTSAFYKNKRLLDQEDDLTFTPVVIKQNETISFTVNNLHITCDRSDLVFIMETIK